MAATPSRTAAAADCRRGIPARARRSRRRLFLRQSRHRLSADRRGLQPRQEDQRQGAEARAGAARKSRGRDGARRLSDDRPAAGGDGARQCRHRQHHQQSDQPVARPRAADPRRRPHADHREGLVRLAQPADPLGAGDVRPGRHGARDGEVGLRVARAGPGRRRGRARASKSRWRIRAGRSIWCCRASRCRRRSPSRSAPIKPRPLAAPAHPDPQAIATLAEWIAAAERPLIITAALPADAVPRARRNSPSAAPFRSSRIAPRTLCLPSSHPMHFGFEPGALLTDADLVIVLESDVPWIPHLQHPPGGCRVAHIGEDPFYVRYPMRRFPSDLAIQAGAAQCAGRARTRGRTAPADGGGAHRRAPRAADRAHAHTARAARQGFRGRRRRSRRNISRTRSAKRSARTRSSSTNIRCGPIIARAKSPALSSRSGPPAGSAGASARRSAPSSRRRTSSSSRRSATAPTCSPIRRSATGLSAVHKLPILTVVFNNSRYGAVRRATLSMFKDGAAGENDGRMLADLDPVAAVRGDGARAGRPCRARRKTRRPARRAGARARRRRQRAQQALLNVITPY